MKITIKMALENRGCFSEKQVRDFANGRKWISHKTLTKLGLNPANIIWFIEKIKLGGKKRFLLYADVAESTFHIYEKEYPEDKRLRETIQAIRDYVSEKITLKELEAASNAYDAIHNVIANAYNAAYCSDIAEKKNQIKLIDAFLRKIK